MELLEREADLARLDEHFREATAGHGRVVFIAGEAGVGKSSLADTFCHRIADQAVIPRASFDSLSTPSPLGPLRDLAPALGLHLDRYAADRDGRDLLFRAVLDSLVAGARPIVIVAEDAHWADGATIELLRFLARRIGERAVLTIVTYRDDEIGSDHPLRLLLGDLATAPAVHRMTLSPLSPDAIRQLAAGSGQDAAALHRLTGGNPFFATEVLASGDKSVPATVGDAVLARAARLSAEARAILEVTAVIGAGIDLDLLQRIAGPVLEEVEACIARGLLKGNEEGIAFRHELAREAILAAITLPRRRLLHARVLAALRETLPSSGGVEASDAKRDLALLAHHAEAAGDREAVLSFAVAAAVEAAALHAHREAAAQYARSLRFADSLPEADRARLFEGRSVACYFSDQGEEAIAARQAALDLWRSLDDPLKAGESLRWLSRCYWYEGRGAEAEQAAASALNVLDSLPPGPELAMAYSNLSHLRMLAHDLDGTLLWGNRAIALAEQLGETETLVHALANVGTARAFVADGQGHEELTRSLRLSLERGLPDHAGRALTNLAWEALWAMQLDETEQRLSTGIAYAIEHDLDQYRWYLLATRAALRARKSAWTAAEAELRILLQQPALSPLPRIVALTAWGQVCARRGHPEAATPLNEALALAERTGQFIRLGPVRTVRAEAALLDGDIARSRAEMREVHELVFSRGNQWQRGELAWLLQQAGERDVPSDNLPEPYALQITGDFAKAAAVWRELGCPYEEARALAESDDPTTVRRAVATFEHLGALPAIRHAIRRLRALGVSDLPSVRRGPHASTRANAAGLTRREAEVLALLAEGLRNAEIAARLYLSPKTVRHHVSVILVKLGAATRTEAARAAAQLGLIPS